MMLGPWLVHEWRELLGYNFSLASPATMTRTTPEWWENEWRKMIIPWRKGETFENFFQSNYAMIESITGKDMANPAKWLKGLQLGGGGFWKKKDASKVAKPQALVPLCGDSPMVVELARQGYEVDAVEVAETAIRTLVEKADVELKLEPSLLSSIHLHYKDFFSPNLWRTDIAPGKQYDFIYDRQALSAVNPEQREDYAYILKSHLKEDGVLYIEGIFRTGRVKGNKVRGPPYGLSRAEVKQLFPQDQGYFVQCGDREDRAIALLDRESKVLRKIPKDLYVTPFPCVVVKESNVRQESR